ncbi:hypothetical protein BPORC_1780 [Bifidobacterium porcinum]|nr:hypothetical protein BPORC_1780 [Bifidobacterium porcinum]
MPWLTGSALSSALGKDPVSCPGASTGVVTGALWAAGVEVPLCATRGDDAGVDEVARCRARLGCSDVISGVLSCVVGNVRDGDCACSGA